MPIITNFEEIKNYLEALTKIASGYHQILCEKCEHNGSEEWCWYCEQGFWYEFGAEHVEC
ncbi:MAG: hypothetical protein COX30_00720 [Candidatus Moranbacteria bacterium CG23_combo_of_CG06-09_8_20_14_all_39_10]|nr:MAG: hypothetical protein COX30_00720 [Candidatus Moranbacteria bacterium CG23_combo_of_CG06-09_8_20_14_all_39_10]